MRVADARVLLALVLCAACSSPGSGPGESAQPRKYTLDDFIRVVAEGGRIKVESAAMSFDRDGSSVTLVAMVHLAEESFFRNIDVHVRNATRVWAEGNEEPGQAIRFDGLPTPAVKLIRYYGLLSELAGLENQKDWERRAYDSRWRRADISMDEVRESVDGDSPDWAAYERNVDAALNWLEHLRKDPGNSERRARLVVVRSIRASLDGTGIGTPEQFGAHRERVAWRTITEGAADAGTAQTILFGAGHAPVIAEELCRAGYVEAAISWHVVLEVEDEPW